MDFATILFFGVGLLFVVLSVPLVRRRVKPNGIYGLRIPATFKDEWVWYEANARSGRDLLVLGIGISLLALVATLIPGLSPERETGALLAFTFVGTIVMAVVGIVRANRMARERKAATDRGDRRA